MVKISHKGLEWHSLILISTVLIQPFSLSCNLQHMLQCPLKLTRVLPDPPSQKWALQQMLKVFLNWNGAELILCYFLQCYLLT